MMDKQSLASMISAALNWRLARYMLASIGALAVDVASFLALLQSGLGASLAAAAGYMLGIIAHWLLSSRAVFQDKVANSGFERTRQKALFLASALAGLAITTLIVSLSAYAGFDPRIGKGFAIVIAFSATWLLRSRIVFGAANRAPFS